MRKGSSDSLKRRSIMLPDSFIDEMAEVRDLVGAQSDSEVIRRAFRLYKRLIDPKIELIVKDKQTGEQTRLELVT